MARESSITSARTSVPLQRAVGGAAADDDPLPGVVDAEGGLSGAEEEPTLGPHEGADPAEDRLLGRQVEVDEDVAQVDHVERAHPRQRSGQVALARRDHAPQRRGDLPLGARPGEVPDEHRRRQAPVDLELAEPPVRVRATISRERSVAVMETRVAALGSASPSSIAIVYGSCPLEQAADQICSRSAGPRTDSSDGRTVEARAVNGSPSRNHDVSFVVSASTILRVDSGLGRVRTESTSWPTSGRPMDRAMGSRRASTRYSLPGASTMALSRCTSWRTQSKLVAARVIVVLRRGQGRWEPGGPRRPSVRG